MSASKRQIFGSLFGARVEGAAPASPEPVGASAAMPRLRESDPGPSPQRHAERLLAWLQGEAGRTGIVPAAEMMMVYAELTAQLGWSEISWNRVAPRFRLLVGPKCARDVIENGKRRRLQCYFVPEVGAIVTPQPQKRDLRPLGHRIQALEDSNRQLAATIHQLLQVLVVRPAEGARA